MIGKLNHVAIAVPDLEAGSDQYRSVLGAEVSEPVDLPEHGVTTVLSICPIQKLNCFIRLETTHRSPDFWNEIRPVACIICVMKSRILIPPEISWLTQE